MHTHGVKAETEARPKGKPRPRLSIPLTDDGTIAFDALTDKVRDRLRLVVDDPQLRAGVQLDASAPAAADAPIVAEGFPPEVAALLYDVLSRLLIAWAQRTGYSADHAAVLAFTVEDKSALTPLTCKLIDKYLPGGLTRYGDEIALALLAVTLVSQKLTLLRESGEAEKTSSVSQFVARQPQTAM